MISMLLHRRSEDLPPKESKQHVQHDVPAASLEKWVRLAGVVFPPDDAEYRQHVEQPEPNSDRHWTYRLST